MFNRHINIEEFTSIPFTNKLFSINADGIIKTNEEVLIEHTLDENKEKVVWLPLWNGCNFYKIALILLFTFKPTNVPFIYWKQLDVMFKDGNPSNINISNLVWKFPVGLESKKYPGYAFIPGFSLYVINKYGSLKNYKTGKENNAIISSSGYVSISIVPDNSDKIGYKIKRHRAVALAWLSLPYNNEELIVNHINGLPGDDRVENLEWLTQAENIKHASEFGLHYPFGIFLKNIHTNKIFSYITYQLAEYFLNISKNKILPELLKTIDRRNIISNFEIRTLEEAYNWENFNVKDHSLLIDFLHRKQKKFSGINLKETKKRLPVFCMDIKTGIVTKYETSFECSHSLNIRKSTLDARLLRSNEIIYESRYRFSTNYEFNNEKKLSYADCLELQKRSDTTVIVRNAKNKEERIFSTIILAAKYLNISKNALFHILSKENQQILPGYFQVQYKRNLTIWKNPENLEEENNLALYGNIVLCRNIETNEIKEYANATECARDLGLSDLTISVRLRDNSQKIYPGNLQFKRKYDQRPWKTNILDSDSFADGHYPIPVKIKDIFTNEKWEFNSISEASEKLNIPIHSIKDRKNSNFEFPYLNFEIKFNNESFKNYDEIEIELFRQAMSDGKSFRGRGFIMTNIDTGEVKVFYNRKQIAEIYGVDPYYISNLAISKKIFRDKWRIEYYLD